MKRSARLTMALVSVIVSVVALVTPAANAATVPGRAAQASQIMEHACQVVGIVGDIEGVVCADFVANTDGTVSAQVEGICQHESTGATVQCAHIDISYGLYSTVKHYYDTESMCGHQYGPCPSGRFIQAGAHTNPFEQATCYNLWTVAYAGSGVELPGSDQWELLGANLGSGHKVLCL